MTQRGSLLGKNSLAIRAFIVVVLAITWGMALHGQTVPGHFIDATQKLGVQFRQQASPTTKKYLLETMGSGVALFDYDNDGRLDIFFANGAPINDPTPKDTIPQKTDPKYLEPPLPSETRRDFRGCYGEGWSRWIGYSTGVAVGDYDNDGFDDLLCRWLSARHALSQQRRRHVHRRNGSAGVAGSGWVTSAAWVDYDNDGRLDLIVPRYMQWDF